MEQKFKIGDIVVLKSKSPQMTIIQNSKVGDIVPPNEFSGHYLCAWFDNDDKDHRAYFPQDALE